MIPKIKNVPSNRIAIEIIIGTTGDASDCRVSTPCDTAVTTKNATPTIANHAVSATTPPRTANECVPQATTKNSIEIAIADIVEPLNQPANPPQHAVEQHAALLSFASAFKSTCGKPVAARSLDDIGVEVDMKSCQ